MPTPTPYREATAFRSAVRPPEPPARGEAGAGAGRARVPFVSGVAGRYGRFGVGHLGAGDLDAAPTSAPFAYAPGAFAESVGAALAGRWEIRLLVEHDPARELASTRDRSLLVAADDDADGGVGFVIMANTPRGRTAARFVREHPEYREASAGGKFARGWTVPAPGPEGAFVIVRFQLEEISLVRHGGQPGTRVSYED
jgi:hypothetical protein